MKTALFGRITAADIEDADLLAGIVPTSFLVAGDNDLPPAELGLPCESIPLSNMMDYETAVAQAEARLVTFSYALIIKGHHPNLADRARRMGSLVYEI